MLRVLSHPRRLCTGLTRRDLLQAGGLGVAGLGLDTLLSNETAQAASGPRVQGELSNSFGKAKRCIVLFLYGSPSQLETFDMKPNAPVEIRGTMQPIPSALPGLDVCEHLPHMAKIMDRTTVVRSLTHPHPIHGVAYAMTGASALDVNAELEPNDPRHHPYFGSVVEYFDRQRRGGKLGDFVQNAALPFPFSSQRVDQPFRAGPYAAFLGGAYNPTWTEFLGQGTKKITKARPGFSWTGLEPYLGCTPDSYFRMAATDAPTDMTVDRMSRRRSLLQQFEGQRRDLERSLAGTSHSKMQEMAFNLISSTKVADALDVRKESPATRESYGHTLFGQSCLAARRMLEAGTRLVSVFWDEYGLAGDAWDTHYEHFPRMIDQLLPGLDRAYAGLILDLEQRGMLDDTLVVCISEHGRTPKINKAQDGGRDHWSQAYCAQFAGGGIAKGRVLGATDAHAAEVTDHPLSPKDMLATMYHLLGIDPHATLPDRVGRPQPMLPEGSHVVTEMLA
ncbi:MAG: DUF1501 domain-containing protein [Planctomycetota bacterium]|nr:MAG: DUF1501 domain-containing protein [Planctomycetota bacterium]